jgi:hypothetical protein
VQAPGLPLLRLGGGLERHEVRFLHLRPSSPHHLLTTDLIPIRSFIAHKLADFAKANPQIEITVSPRPNQHPIIRGSYSMFTTPRRFFIIEHLPSISALTSSNNSCFIYSQWPREGYLRAKTRPSTNSSESRTATQLLWPETQEVQQAREVYERGCQRNLFAVPRREARYIDYFFFFFFEGGGNCIYQAFELHCTYNY